MKRFSLLVLYLFVSLLTACNASNATADVPSTGLANYQVVDLQGNTIAQVEDVLIAADSGQVSYVLVILQRDPFSYGKAAFIDVSMARTAVPWDYFSLDSASEQLQFQIDGSVLYAAPLLKDKPNHLETGWNADIQAYWQAYSVPIKQE